MPVNLDISDTFLETPSAYVINYGEKEIDSTFLKVKLILFEKIDKSARWFFFTCIEVCL